MTYSMQGAHQAVPSQRIELRRDPSILFMTEKTSEDLFIPRSAPWHMHLDAPPPTSE
jgi:hypothetical protein